MATVVLRTGIRSIATKNLFEKKLAPAFCSIFFGVNQDASQLNSNVQLCDIAKRLYSKRNVQYTNTSIMEELSESDSDSDEEQERGETAFWRRKMRTLHSHLDVNKDGVISYEDFMLLVDRFSELGHLTPDAKREFKQVVTDMWEEQWGEISPYNHVCIEKYLEEMHHVLNDKSLKRKCHHFLPFLFKAVDKDGSGVITVEEFKLFFECLGLSHDHAVVSFSYIDSNEDGRISFEEFVTLGRDFFLTEDHTRPSKHFWGPLVD